ncbi:ABC transporter ATP-binding protein [Azospirillum rugosum]|uniref:ABC transport system ATP-binding protein n=1 Tax=Azospirillum rugosum TaxID=416170 RepID=A0ABS4SS42_9PROT|nr:ATP-binding cassette domain-containing protein [Azospirillum rugosum]MBP2295257.1 putative ABC transport system ATP-binding protein [Azospirillum rugosum]MDQ0528631.1 putative ABC transport system ATP-binding protein [Azospirillum rugosum]
MTAAGVLYDLRDVRKARGGARGRFRLDIPELTVLRGEVVIVRGPSGCGKSTLLDLLAMTLRPDDAERFTFDPGQGPVSIHASWRHNQDGLSSLRGAFVGYIVQTGGLLPYLSARENIELPARLAGRYDPQRVRALAEHLDIAHLLARSPGSLSVGERQRVAIARALAHDPGVVIADEPTAALDPVNAEVTFRLLLELVTGIGTTAIVATHDPNRGAGSGFALIEPVLERSGDDIRAVFSRGGLS